MFSRRLRNSRFAKRWCRFWLPLSHAPIISRLALKLTELLAPQHFDRVSLAYMHPKGYIASNAQIYHDELVINNNVYIGSNSVIFQGKGNGRIELKQYATIHENVFVESGQGGQFVMGEYSSIHPNSFIMAYHSSIKIGKRVMIASNCALYPYDHGTELGVPIADQPLAGKGPIIIEDNAWLGTRVVVLSGVTIGEGAIIGAGSVVTKNIPANAIAVGNPAKVVKFRE